MRHWIRHGDDVLWLGNPTASIARASSFCTATSIATRCETWRTPGRSWSIYCSNARTRRPSAKRLAPVGRANGVEWTRNRGTRKRNVDAAAHGETTADLTPQFPIPNLQSPGGVRLVVLVYSGLFLSESHFSPVTRIDEAKKTPRRSAFDLEI